MSNLSEYRIDLDQLNDNESGSVLREDFLNSDQTLMRENLPTNPWNNDQLNQFTSTLRQNLTTTFPFVLLLVVKLFSQHSSGQIFLHSFIKDFLYFFYTFIKQFDVSRKLLKLKISFISTQIRCN